MSSRNPFDAYNRHWPPNLIKRLQDTYICQIDASDTHVLVLFLEERLRKEADIFRALGIFKPTAIANQMALDFFKGRHRMFFDLEEDWEQFYKLKPSVIDAPEDENMVGWAVSEAGELLLKFTDGGDGDTYKAYVKRQPLLENYDASALWDEL